MRIVDMTPSQLKKYVEDNYSINSLLENMSKTDILDALKNNEDIYEDHDHE